jgi:hypothetical protein
MKLPRLLSLAIAAACLLAVQLLSFAQDPEQALLADFPPLSIDSVERAEEAIRRLPEVNEQLTRRYSREKTECYERFFVASCLSDLRTRERRAFKAVNRVEVEAKAFLRRERAAERDRAVAERERRAAEQGTKPVPFSGAARNNGRGEQGSGERRESSKTRIQIERIPGDDDAVNGEPVAPVDADSFATEPRGTDAPAQGEPAAGNETTEPAVEPADDASTPADSAPDAAVDTSPAAQPTPEPAAEPTPEPDAGLTPEEAHERSRQRAREEAEASAAPAVEVPPGGPAVPTPEFMADLPPGAADTTAPPATVDDAAQPATPADASETQRVPSAPEATSSGEPQATGTAPEPVQEKPRTIRLRVR